MTATPADPRLYAAVKAEAKRRFHIWPSAYASGWLVRTYKARGGTFREDTSGPKTFPLARWYAQEWVDACAFVQHGTVVPCARTSAAAQPMPYCRPLRRLSPLTPVTVTEADPAQIRARCRVKHRSDAARAERIPARRATDP